MKPAFSIKVKSLLDTVQLDDKFAQLLYVKFHAKMKIIKGGFVLQGVLPKKMYGTTGLQADQLIDSKLRAITWDF